VPARANAARCGKRELRIELAGVTPLKPHSYFTRRFGQRALRDSLQEAMLLG
jgi:hypothetical protein